MKRPKPKPNMPAEEEKQKAYEDFKKAETAEYQRLNFGNLP